MSFDGIKNQLVARLGVLGFAESKKAFDFTDAGASELGNTFILNRIAGEKDEGDSLVNKFDDTQAWNLMIAIAKSAHSDVVNRDKLSRKIDDVIKDLDNPTNWENITNGAKFQEYQSWELAEEDNYFLLTIILKIKDEITF